MVAINARVWGVERFTDNLRHFQHLIEVKKICGEADRIYKEHKTQQRAKLVEKLEEKIKRLHGVIDRQQARIENELKPRRLTLLRRYLKLTNPMGIYVSGKII